MFTGKLPAGTGTFECQVKEIDLRLIGFGSAALAGAPKGNIAIPFAHPFSGNRQILSRFPGCIIGGQCKYLFFGNIQKGCFKEWVIILILNLANKLLIPSYIKTLEPWNLSEPILFITWICLLRLHDADMTLITAFNKMNFLLMVSASSVVRHLPVW